MLCKNCGKELKENERFCSACGAQQPEATAEQAAPAEANPEPQTQLENVASTQPLEQPSIQVLGNKEQAVLPRSKKSKKRLLAIASSVAVVVGIIVCVIIAVVKPHTGKNSAPRSEVMPSEQEESESATEVITNRPTDSEITDILSKKQLSFNGFSISIGEAVNNCMKNYEVTIISIAENESEALQIFDKSTIDNYKTKFDLNNVFVAVVSGDLILVQDLPYYTEYQKSAVFCILPFDENGNHVDEWDTVMSTKEFSNSARQYLYGEMF